MRKQNKRDEIVRYKVGLVAQGFSQRPDINYNETYSSIGDSIIFNYLINLTTCEILDICLMDVVTLYLYASTNNYIYIKIHDHLYLMNLKMKY